ncbi:TPA: hydrolase TatD [Patescibacteria group bacterium]|nr:MAG: TatD family hydrolase [Parcubacteria group bacterium GW2011_GWF2_40_10]KKR47754.1 MAG: TatD family hydrolase [Parcubacteria group bacterium GW2011_GWA2_40_143]KKR60088.1 MAG: TatD family hydrolase [Parcubacteria group bacterium GW2011_GWC2_40_31]KKR83107.1 MAG: TatD family hydrolase [Parcubacteria group bacterium GW2011_GWD2_40_9]HBB57035.1 hydrolase TatD [Patescibacteria group bacterium]
MRPKLIDTHTHVNFSAFKNDGKEVIKRALDDGTWIINVGSQADTSERAIKIANEYKEGVYATVGLHPAHLEEQEVDYKEEGDRINYRSRPEEFDEDFYLKLAQNNKVVAIGECGLDYCRNSQSKISNLESKNWKEKQKEVFKKHLELANKANKPIIIHCRDAHDDLLKILNLAVKPPSGVMHFFTGTLEQAEKYIELGFYISFSGVITFTDAYNEVVRNIPSNRTLVETDAPYVSPKPYRGKRNEPSYVKYAAQKIADLRGVSFDEIAAQTTENAKKLFKI